MLLAQEGKRERCGEEGNQEVEDRKTGISLRKLPSAPSTNCFFKYQDFRSMGQFLTQILIYKLVFKWMLAKSLRLLERYLSYIC